MLACSSTYDTDPVGEVLDQPSFLNACVRVRDRARAAGAARRGQGDRARARPARGRRAHGPRAIDIDVLLLGDVELRHERMTLPHEQLLSRRFVLIPALELDFELRRARRPAPVRRAGGAGAGGGRALGRSAAAGAARERLSRGCDWETPRLGGDRAVVVPAGQRAAASRR